jgi:hypothetical protein
MDLKKQQLNRGLSSFELLNKKTPALFIQQNTTLPPYCLALFHQTML